MLFYLLRICCVDGCIILRSINTQQEPVTVAARSRAKTVFAHPDSGILGSNPTQGMDIWCVHAFILCLCCPVFR
jgi:hypothetical protein